MATAPDRDPRLFGKAAARLDLDAIEASLRRVQQDFSRINDSLRSPREPLEDEVLANMLAGYRCVDQALKNDIDLFKPGNSGRVLELNHIVLCGTGKKRRNCFKGHLRSTEKRFYGDDGSGIGALMECWKMLRGQRVSRRAAGLFTQLLSRPQLFTEGNHRTGALLMSYVLVRGGSPPFVLTVDNARAFFDPAALVKNARRRSFDEVLRLPKLSRRLAQVVESTADPRYLKTPE